MTEEVLASADTGLGTDVLFLVPADFGLAPADFGLVPAELGRTFPGRTMALYPAPDNGLSRVLIATIF